MKNKTTPMMLLPKKWLGNTGILVSPLGLGTVKFGRTEQVHYPKPFSLPSKQTIQTLLLCAKSSGINLIDTAPAYGSSEERLGKALIGQRQDWVLSTKVGEAFDGKDSSFDFSKKAIINSIERSLKRLNTDYLDIVLVHSNGNDQQIIEQDEVFLTLASLKDAGKLRAFGMSTKTIQGGLLTIEHADVLMLSFNAKYTEERPIIAAGYQKNKGILIKKALASGHLIVTPYKNTQPTHLEEGLSFILQEPGVSSIIIGTINPAHLESNIACVYKALYRRDIL